MSVTHRAAGAASLLAFAPQASASSRFATYDVVVAFANCSGSVVRFPGAADRDKTLVLTNGHCIGTMPEPDTYVYDKAASRTVTLLGGEEAHSVAKLSLDRLQYATMTGTDVAVYRSTIHLRAAQQDLRRDRATAGRDAPGGQDRHRHPLWLLEAALRLCHRRLRSPLDKTAIDIPSGYWKQHYVCAIDDFAHRLDEGVYSMNDSIRYSNCVTLHGSSGDGMLHRGP